MFDVYLGMLTAKNNVKTKFKIIKCIIFDFENPEPVNSLQCQLKWILMWMHWIIIRC